MKTFKKHLDTKLKDEQFKNNLGNYINRNRDRGHRCPRGHS